MTDKAIALSIDIGTSSTRVLLWDATGREAGSVRAQVQYRMKTTSDGGVEMPAEELLAHVGECLDMAIQQGAGNLNSLRVVGISTFWHALVGLDTQGKPVTPIYNWADNRAAAAAKRLQAEWNETEIHARTGCVLHPSYYPAKLTWLRESQPDLYKQVDRWCSPSEYLFGAWFGADARRVSVSMASGTGLFHQDHCTWDADLLKALDLSPDRLSPIVDLKESSRGLQGEYAVRWPALKDIPFFPAVGDGACGNVGSGCVSATRAAINLGTSGAIRVVWDEKSQPHSATIVPSAPPGLWRYRVDSHRPVMGGAFSDGGDVYAWMNRTLQLPSAEETEQEISRIEPGSHGLTFLPFLAGERSIGWRPDARASLVGMTLDTRPIDILRAAMEAVALRFALASQLLRGVFPEAREIVASGNALAHSPAWTQMFADALGQSVTLAAEPEASSRGAALLAMEAAGLIGAADETQARLGQTFTPDAKRHERYQEMLTRQQVLCAQLVGTH